MEGYLKHVTEVEDLMSLWRSSQEHLGIVPEGTIRPESLFFPHNISQSVDQQRVGSTRIIAFLSHQVSYHAIILSVPRSVNAAGALNTRLP